ncbi:hypothetical protein [Aestuariimicrobium ganziense]|uniref:hypothetical protein n=1 Tax=Aestuariimicrobium ganziense TaxID=2773677 RepID=UPI0019453AB1|nr:hypothetical protein [Aestuariimicrobium ganziense]
MADQVSRMPDRVAQWIVVLNMSSAILMGFVVIGRAAAGDWFGVAISLFLGVVFLGQAFIWRGSVRAVLLSDDQGLRRPGVAWAPNAAASWSLTWAQVDAAGVFDGRRGRVLVVRPTPPAPIHASRWLQGVDRRVAAGAVMCPLDPDMVGEVERLLRSKGVPAL